MDNNSSLTQLGFLHEHLSEGPADPPDEGRQQHHEEALQVELGRLEGKHEEAAGNQHDHEDQEWVLVEKRPRHLRKYFKTPNF